MRTMNFKCQGSKGEKGKWKNGIMEHWNNDGLVKSLKRLFSVIPAQAGIQSF
jgi:hypothetical protein